MNFFEDAELQRLRDTLREAALTNRYLVSDLIEQQGGQTLQYVDLVMEGGGTLGIALVGYIYALEQAGLRFLSVGGASVGAIVSLLLACCGEREEEKGEVLCELLAGMDIASFVDGGLFPAALSRLLGSGKAGDKKWQVLLLGLLSSGTITKRLGLNPGNAFLNWLTDSLARFDVHTMADARARIEHLPIGLTHRERGRNFATPTLSLKIVAADITTSSKIIFPEMSPLYWANPERVNPALFVRASMSIPGFFYPMEVSGVSDIIDRSEKWADLCSFDKEPPDRILFTDGGLLSNFPISLFHKNRIPNAPTLGARLGSASRAVREIHSVGSYGSGLFKALRHYSDYDFIFQNPDYRRLIAHIPTGDHNWLNFNMTEADKLDLFKSGMRTAHEFLESFDWPAYKELRRAQLEVDRVARRERAVAVADNGATV